MQVRLSISLHAVIKSTLRVVAVYYRSISGLSFVYYDASLALLAPSQTHLQGSQHILLLLSSLSWFIQEHYTTLLCVCLAVVCVSVYCVKLEHFTGTLHENASQPITTVGEKVLNVLVAVFPAVPIFFAILCVYVWYIGFGAGSTHGPSCGRRERGSQAELPRAPLEIDWSGSKANYVIDPFRGRRRRVGRGKKGPSLPSLSLARRYT